MTVAPARPAYWLIGGFVSALLILLVAVPLLNHRIATLISDINQQEDPVDKESSRIQAALSHEISAILGFQATADPTFSDFYIEQTHTIAEIMTSLQKAMPTLGPGVQTRFNELESAIDHWHKDVETNKLSEVQLLAGDAATLLFQPESPLRRESAYEAAHEATARLSEAVVKRRAEERMEVGSLAHTFTTLSIIFGAFALAAIGLIANTLRRLNSTASFLEARAHEEEALRQVAHSLTAAYTLEEVLGRITESVALAGKAEMVFIETVNFAQNEITCVAGYGAAVPREGTKSPYIRSVAEEVLRAREPRIIRDVSRQKERDSVFGHLARNCGACGAMIVPLVSDSQLLGALFLVRRHPDYFTHAEFPRVRILADMAALAMQRVLTLEKVRKMQREEHFLSEAAKVLASSLDYNETVKTVVRLAVPQMADWSALHMIADTGEIHTVEVAHADPARLALVQRLQQNYPPRPGSKSGPFRVIRTGRPELHSEITDQLLKNAAEDAGQYELLRRLNMKSAIVVPLSAGKEIFGSLTFVSEQTQYGPDDLVLAEDIARHAAMAIENARLYTSAERAVRLRDEVLRVVSHDLRNPIGNIQMTARMLPSATLPEVRENLVQVILRASERMNRLIEDLIAAARMREGEKIPLHVQPESPTSIIDEACEIFSVPAHQKSIDLRSQKPHMVPTVTADRHRVLQVLSNLLDNAIKFTPEGGRITVSCEPYESRVRFAVTDTGRGIAPEHLSKIFELFWQDKHTAHMGAGLGLAIAKAIVEQHGGTISAESKPGVGTTVYFDLPQATRKEQGLEDKKAG
jgi:signal transduction histidine kinase